MKETMFRLMLSLMALVIIVTCAIASSPSWRQLYDGAENLFREGRPTQSLSMARDSLNKAESEFGHQSIYTMRSLILLGDLSRNSGAFAEAHRYYKRALEIQQKRFGNLHINTVWLINELAGVDVSLGYHENARKLFNQSIDVCSQSGNTGHPRLAQSLIGLADLEKAAGNYDEAENCILKAISIMDLYSKYQPSTKLAIANARVNLADNLKIQGKFREAGKQYRVAIQYLETRGEASQSAIADCLVAMGDSYVSSGKKARALDSYRRALAIAVNGPSINNLTVALVSKRLAEVYRSAGNVSEARRYYRKAVAALEICSPSGCPLLADTKKTLNDLIDADSLKTKDTSA